MNHVSSITQKGQVTIPHALRKQLHLATGDKVIFAIERGAITVKPAPSFLSLRGSVPVRAPVTDREMDTNTARHISNTFNNDSKE